MTSVSGGDHKIDYVASDTKGGAADLTDSDAVTEAIVCEVDAGRIPIVQLHTGKEYTHAPTSYAQDRFSLTHEAGARLIVGHHPHVAQGVGLMDGGVLVVHSLGNFAFDQARLETMLGLAARVDLAGGEVVRARLIPLYVEDFRPRPVGGELADRFLRRLGEVSAPWSTCGCQPPTTQECDIRRIRPARKGPDPG